MGKGLHSREAFMSSLLLSVITFTIMIFGFSCLMGRFIGWGHCWESWGLRSSGWVMGNFTGIYFSDALDVSSPNRGRRGTYNSCPIPKEGMGTFCSRLLKSCLPSLLSLGPVCYLHIRLLGNHGFRELPVISMSTAHVLRFPPNSDQ